MNSKTLRMSAAAAMAAVAFGVAAPAAHATEARAVTAQSATAAQPELTASQARQLLAAPGFSAELGREGRAAIEAVAEGETSPRVKRSAASSAGRALLNAIKKQGPKFYNAAVKAAKGGTKSFNKWVGGLSWYHPVRILISASGADVIDWVIRQLAG
ncbi:hypothetical protein [Streptomyces caatingaensis]|uniref:Secreted protein n=1 Tax=Streptomyces caatingaensis TaxID=1678637 RepID=A0A0K9XFR4_9ACTN|nr:hypothetical protein [Streptomyces caatingaensis]KNB51517.1 hypothetical protein AC230_14115 [Streptomyces caatingaensis]